METEFLTETFEREIKNLKVAIKQEPEDDEFVETPKKVVIKTEPNTFSYDFETNNNFIVKAEDFSNEFNDHKGNFNKEDVESSAALKLEIEDEGLRYNYKEIITIDCSTCNRSFNTTRGLLNHLKQRIRCRRQTPFIAQTWTSFLKKVAKPFKCQVCLKYFSTLKEKEQHLKAHFGKNCMMCLFCGKPFIRQKEYLLHYRIHTVKQLPIKCKICTRKFPSKMIYFKHFSNHKRKKTKYMCKICCHPYSKKALFEKHKNKEKLACPYCPIIYCRKLQLASHLRGHTGERPYECAICSLRFSHKGNLITHSRIHTGYKPYLCQICLKSFSRRDYLNKHYLSIHKKNEKIRKPYKIRKKTLETSKNSTAEILYCPVCNKNFPSKSSLSSHWRVHNKGKTFQCTVCDKSFSYKGLLTGHMKIHLDYRPFECTLCPKKFIKRNDLTRHTYTHTKEKNFRCEICYEKFSRKDVLALHIRNHAGQRPYRCEYCPKAFVQKSNLTHHLKRCRTIPKEEIVDD